MTYLVALLSGLLQGIAEFLPISSSGHFAVLQSFFDLTTSGEDDLLFRVLLHIATLITLCLVYRKDIAEMFREIVGFIHDYRHPSPVEDGPNPARRLALMILIGTLPLLIVLPFINLIDKLYSSTIFIGIAFIFTGTALYVADKAQNGRKNAGTMTVIDALIIGACQAFAALPGVSRAGLTIASGMATGLERNFAVKFSFLLSLPAIFAWDIIKLSKALEVGAVEESKAPMYLLGMLAAGVSAYFSISLVKSLSQKGKLAKFCYYCFTAGIVSLVLSFVL